MGPKESQAPALAAVHRAMTPARRKLVEEMIAELDCITVRRAEGEAQSALMFRAYVDRAGTYPADVIRQVVAEWDSKWFPAWAELKERLDKALLPRSRKLYALDHGFIDEATLKDDEEKPVLSEEERAAIHAETQATIKELTRKCAASPI